MAQPLIRLVFLTQVAATLYMVGVIWFVQVVHYPLMAGVGGAGWKQFEAAHTRLTGYVVGPAMLLELVTAVALLRIRPQGVGPWWPVIGLALLAVNWVSTWAIQVPCHARLAQGFDEVDHRRLVRSNWLRTWCWSLRGALVVWMMWKAWG